MSEPPATATTGLTSAEPVPPAAEPGSITHTSAGPDATQPTATPAPDATQPAKPPMRIEAKLGWNVFKLDTESHILIDHAICRERCTLRPCTRVCPADLYTLDEAGDLKVDFEGCLECGSCLIVCPEGALSWVYPKAGQGVMYKFC